ncbi:hypothetical protein B0H10DRAFT_2082465 [Mycena sp. CBHHK59/15]|nr:hypothetical protein B0H10DRAFT_2082465 [Mycena sp. CBHHK59/15]
MRPTAPSRLSLLCTSLGPSRRPLIVPFHARSALSSSSFSTHPTRAQEQQQLPKSQQQRLSYFHRLDNSIAETFGIGRDMRITLYVILGIASAVETWFYCFWMFHWWKRRGCDEVEGSDLVGA